MLEPFVTSGRVSRFTARIISVTLRNHEATTNVLLLTNSNTELCPLEFWLRARSTLSRCFDAYQEKTWDCFLWLRAEWLNFKKPPFECQCQRGARADGKIRRSWVRFRLVWAAAIASQLELLNVRFIFAEVVGLSLSSDQLQQRPRSATAVRWWSWSRWPWRWLCFF